MGKRSKFGSQKPNTSYLLPRPKPVYRKGYTQMELGLWNRALRYNHNCICYIFSRPTCGFLPGCLFNREKKQLSVGLHPADLQPCNCPDWRPKKEPRDSYRDTNGSLDRGTYMSRKKGSWSETPLRTAAGKKDIANLRYLGKMEATIYRGTDVRMAHQLPGKPAAGAGGKHVGNYWLSPIINRIG